MGKSKKSKNEKFQESQSDVQMQDKTVTTETPAPSVSDNSYISPIAIPLLQGNVLARSVKLLKAAIASERPSKTPDKSAGSKEVKANKRMKRPVKRGVAEVTKCIRKGERGVVFLASDIYPVDIIAHLPVYCEEKGILYAYVGPKKSLGAACKSARPASALMVVEPDSKDCPFSSAYKKAVKAVKREHPYF